MATNNKIRILLISIAFAFISLAVSAKGTDSNEIKKVMDKQEVDWNNGNLEGFMQGYWKSERLTFITKNGITYGWQNTYERYKKSYPNKEAMGTLTFEIISIDELSSKNYHSIGVLSKSKPYMVIGKWKTSGTTKAAEGYFTLIFRKINGNWVIVSDHTS